MAPMIDPDTGLVEVGHLKLLTSGQQVDGSLRMALKVLEPLNAATLVEIFLYGIHCVLFTICCYVLLRKRTPVLVALLFAAVLMFGLSTVDVAISLRMQLRDLPMFFQGKIGGDTVVSHVFPKSPIFVANNLIAELLLLYRCFMVWGFHKYILSFSAFLLLADTIWGWIGAGIPESSEGDYQHLTAAYFWSVFCVNIIMTFLTAGRIWWIIRQARPYLGYQELRVYNMAILIFVESALIYSIFILITLLVPQNQPYRIIATTLMMRIVSIMPTLLIVQVAIGRTADALSMKIMDSQVTTRTKESSTGMVDTMITAGASSNATDLPPESPERWS